MSPVCRSTVFAKCSRRPNELSSSHCAAPCVGSGPSARSRSEAVGMRKWPRGGGKRGEAEQRGCPDYVLAIRAASSARYIYRPVQRLRLLPSQVFREADFGFGVESGHMNIAPFAATCSPTPSTSGRTSGAYAHAGGCTSVSERREAADDIRRQFTERPEVSASAATRPAEQQVI